MTNHTDTPKNDLIQLDDVAAACVAWRCMYEQLERDLAVRNVQLRECVELLRIFCHCHDEMKYESAEPCQIYDEAEAFLAKYEATSHD